MRVALEATAACTRARGGIARYALELARALMRELATRGGRLDLLTRLSRWRKHGLRPAVEGARRRWLQEPFWPPAGGYDVVHGTDARVPYWRGVPRVATLHDVFSLVSEGLAEPRFRAMKRARYAELTERCDRIIAVSESTKADFLRFFDYPPERIDVVHLGVEPRFRPVSQEARTGVRARYGLDDPYLLFIGELSPRKNLQRLVEAFGRSGLAQDLQLVLAGNRTYGTEEIEAAIDASGFAQRVLRPGYVADEDLPALYGEARAFCFPSLYEGFGLPILEAMACGTPVVASDRGAAPEVAAGHAVLADPEDTDAIAAALREAVEPSPGLREAARAHAGRFTWERTAQQTLAVYRRAAGGEGAVV